MTISKKLTKDQKCTCIASIIAVISVVFCLRGRNAAYYNHIPSITQSLSENFATVMSSLMFPLAVMLICIFVKNTRMKLATITYVKLITELLLLSFGININVSADFFYGDLGGLFFIAVDALILLETSNKELDEKRIIGGCWGVISGTLIISALYQTNAAIVYRSIYLILFYGMLFYLAQVMPKSFFSANDEPSTKDEKVHLAKEKLLLAFILFVSALCSLFTYLLVSISMHRSSIPIELSAAKILCYSCWIVLCLSATSLFFVHFKKHSTLHLIVAASITGHHVADLVFETETQRFIFPNLYLGLDCFLEINNLFEALYHSEQDKIFININKLCDFVDVELIGSRSIIVENKTI